MPIVRTPTSAAPRESLAASFVLSYGLAAALLAALLYVGGIWNFLANTRLLDLLIEGGVVMYHDDQVGFVAGVPDLKYFVMSQDPIDWRLLWGAAGLFCVFWWLKVVQFHRIARFCGISGSLGDHSRAYLYGSGLNRLLPFNIGNVGTAAMLKSQGASLDRAAAALFLAEIFVVFEIIVYALVGLALLGWSIWLRQMLWPLIILAIVVLWVRPTRRRPASSFVVGSRQDLSAILAVLVKQPREAISLAILSIVAFGIEDIAAYLIAMAFTSTHVLLNVDFSILLMAVVGSYVTRLVPLTPGGLGQFEWGFATALYFGGLGLPEAVTVAILDNFLRYAVGSVLWIAVLLRSEAGTELGTALDLFRRANHESPRASVSP